jgi:hypothetical protein
MSTDVYDLTGDKTMNATSCVRLANFDLWPVRSTAGTSTLIGETGTSETAYRRPHAPRFAKPNNVLLTGLHLDISSTGELDCVTHSLRISDCVRPSLRLLDRIEASYRPRIAHSAADQVSQIRRPVWSRGSTAHSSQQLPGLSVDSYGGRQLVAYRIAKYTNLRSKRRVDSGQTKSIPGPIRRAVIESTSQLSNLHPRQRIFRGNSSGPQTTSALVKSPAINPKQNQ